jgi:hypothetical protein
LIKQASITDHDPLRPDLRNEFEMPFAGDDHLIDQGIPKRFITDEACESVYVVGKETGPQAVATEHL